MTKYLCNNWLLDEIDMETKYKLLVKGAGNYASDSLIELFWIVLNWMSKIFSLLYSSQYEYSGLRSNTYSKQLIAVS